MELAGGNRGRVADICRMYIEAYEYKARVISSSFPSIACLCASAVRIGAPSQPEPGGQSASCRYSNKCSHSAQQSRRPSCWDVSAVIIPIAFEANLIGRQYCRPSTCCVYLCWFMPAAHFRSCIWRCVMVLIPPRPLLSSNVDTGVLVCVLALANGTNF